MGTQRAAVQELHAGAHITRPVSAGPRSSSRSYSPTSAASTGLGERLRPAEFLALLGEFYRLAANAIVGNEGVVDKFVGDEAIGLFIPGFSGADHAVKAIAAGRAILKAAGRADASPSGPILVGAGIHTVSGLRRQPRLERQILGLHGPRRLSR